MNFWSWISHGGLDLGLTNTIRLMTSYSQRSFDEINVIVIFLEWYSVYCIFIASLGVVWWAEWSNKGWLWKLGLLPHANLSITLQLAFHFQSVLIKWKKALRHSTGRIHHFNNSFCLSSVALNVLLMDLIIIWQDWWRV